MRTIGLCWGLLVVAQGFVCDSRPRRILALRIEKEDTATKPSAPPTADIDPFTKASWYAVEAFGKVFGSKSAETDNNTGPPRSLSETKRRWLADDDYFVSGQVDVALYDENCVFSDPFVSFAGRDRFVDNLQNLNSLVTRYRVKRLDDKDMYDDPNVVQGRFLVQLQLNLPWKPILAWPWGVVCTIDPTNNLIVRHDELWEIAPIEVSRSDGWNE